MKLWQWLTLSALVFFSYTLTAEAEEVVCFSPQELEAKTEYEARLNALLIDISVEIEMEKLRIERNQEAKEQSNVGG